VIFAKDQNGNPDMVAEAIQAFDSDIKMMTERAKRGRRGRAVIARVLRAIKALPSASHIDSVYTFVPWTGDNGEVRLGLKSDQRNSRILREIVGKLGVRITKDQGYGATLNAEFNVDSVLFIITGYKPDTCRVVTETVETEINTANGIIERDGRYYRSETRSKVVCEGAADGDS